MHKTPKIRLNELQGDRAAPVRVVTACGPFTTTSNVQYLPLNDLLQVVVDQKPDVLVLVRRALCRRALAVSLSTTR